MNKTEKNLARKRIGCLGWGFRVVGILFALLVVLFLAAFTVEIITLAQLPEKYPPPGEMVNVGDYCLHLYCTGDPSAKPVVVVSPGSGGTVIDWALVQPEVAKLTRICAYDRFGSGWSFGEPKGQTYQEEANDLRRLLQEAGVEGPYVLAGISYGGAVMQVYASLYPQDVLGLVEVDAVTRGMDARYPQEFLQTLQINRQVTSAFSIPGLFRLMNWFGMFTTFSAFEELPPDLREQAYALAYNSRMGMNMKAEQATRQARDEQFLSAGPLPGVPMIVLVRDMGDLIPGTADADVTQQTEQAWREAQVELAAQVTDGTLIVAEGSGHYITLEKPEVVVDAIRTVIAKAHGSN